MTIGKLYKQNLATLIGANALILDYDHDEDFWTLWGEGDSGPRILQEINGRNRIVIVWDGHSDKTEDRIAKMLAPHLTPLDWALAFSIKLARDHSNNDGAKTELGIHIIDLTGRDHTAWAMRMRYQLLAEMPWVTLHAPLIPEKARFRAGYGSIDGDLFAQNDSGSAWKINVPHATIDQGWHWALADLARQWAATLTKTGDHHDLNNIAGPLIVANQLGKTLLEYPSKSLSVIFITRLRWFGLMDAPHRGEQYPALNCDCDVLIVDDEANSGWGELLEGWMGGDIQVLQIRDNFDDLPSFLGLEATKLAPYISRDYGRPDGIVNNDEAGGNEKPWILVLDLHLFPRGSTKEHEWSKVLSEIAGKLVGQSGLAWPGFDEREIGELNAALDSGRLSSESPAYDIALSLLPRLLALRWPSVPILLFSVTESRGLIAKLARYGNILLSAPKPDVLSGTPLARAHEFIEKWRHEFDAATKLVEVQRSLSKLVDGCSDYTQSHQNNWRHLTIAFEETGDFRDSVRSAIGCIIVDVGEGGKQAAQVRSFKFFEELRRGGVNFYDHVPAYTEINKTGDIVFDLIDKKTPIAQKVSGVLINKLDCRLSLLRCIVPKELYQSNGPGQYTDGVYLDWLNALVELVVAEYLPSLEYDMAKTSMSIWFPTRSVGGDRPEAMRLDFNEHDFRIETLGGQSVAYALFTKAISNRSCFDTALGAVTGLKVRKIPYYRVYDTKTKAYRYESALHWYCKECSKYAGTPERSVRRLKPAGVVYEEEVLLTGHRKCCNHSSQFPAADYTLAAHLADAGLQMSLTEFVNNELGETNVRAESCVDVFAGECLRDFLSVGRLFESDDDVLRRDGFKIAYRRGFFREGVRNPDTTQKAAAPFEKRLLAELMAYAKKADGNTLIELAGLSRRYAPSLPTLTHDDCKPASAGRGQGKQRGGTTAGKHRQQAFSSRSADGPSIRLVLKPEMNKDNVALNEALKVIRAAVSQFPNAIAGGEFGKSNSGKPLIRVTLKDGNANAICRCLIGYSGPDRYWENVHLDNSQQVAGRIR